MKYVLENLTETEYEACLDALDRVREEADCEYTSAMEDILSILDMCEYIGTDEKVALLKEVIDVVQKEEG